MLLVVGAFIVPVGLMAFLGVSWPLVALAAGSFIAGAFSLGLIRAAAVGDHQMAEAASAEAGPLALRVRRAASRWPLTELDPLERAMFAGAVAQARDFDDLDLPCQALIIAAERGVRGTYELDLPLR